ncbi:MAG: hypothetical protein AAF989_09870, partial [Planctomycetota bacterium]
MLTDASEPQPTNASPLPIPPMAPSDPDQADESTSARTGRKANGAREPSSVENRPDAAESSTRGSEPPFEVGPLSGGSMGEGSFGTGSLDIDDESTRTGGAHQVELFETAPPPWEIVAAEETAIAT